MFVSPLKGLMAKAKITRLGARRFLLNPVTDSLTRLHTYNALYSHYLVKPHNTHDLCV